MVDVSRLGVGAGLQLGDEESVLQLLHVDGHLAVKIGHHFRADQTRAKNIATGTEFCGELEFSPLLVKYLQHIQYQLPIPVEDTYPIIPKEFQELKV